MNFFGTTAGATAECAETVLASAEGVFASAGAICSLAGAVIASTEVVVPSAGAVFGVFG